MNKRLLLFLVLTFLISVAAVTLLPASVSARPPAQPPIPHDIEGRETLCIACHASGIAGANKFPPDHEGRTNQQCLNCHKLGENRVAAPTALPTRTPTTAPTALPTAAAPSPSPSPSPTPPPQPTAASADVPPRIPHPLQGRDDCVACHGTGLGGAPKLPASHAGRTSQTCRLCHQPAEPPEGEVPQILPTPVSHVQAVGSSNSCVDCHVKLEGKLAQAAQDWSASIHAQRGVSCADCHGGDPNATVKEAAMSPSAGYIGKPKTVDIPALCASCHARVEAMRQYDLPTDQWSKYQQSIHGKKLAQGDTNVATCFTCHDGHATKNVDDPSARVYALNVPALCGSCHANVELMKPYNIPTNQYELYQKSVHGIALLEKQDLRAPSCATCHGTHGAAPPGFQEVANVCGSCHTATQDYYLKSKHASGAAGTPKCVTCHGRYDVEKPSEAMFEGTGPRQCGSCHAGDSPLAENVQGLHANIADAASAVDQAQAAIELAAGSALIVAPEEVKLAEAKTELITARAAQHTSILDDTKAHTDKATAKSKEIIADADQALAGSVFRREVMGIGLGIMALAIGALWLVRRELYKQLPKE